MKTTGRILGIRSDLRRQAIFVAIACLAVMVGYASGVLFKSGPDGPSELAQSPAENTQTETAASIAATADLEDPAPLAGDGSANTAVYPDPFQSQTEVPFLAYEEALPSEVYESEFEGVVTEGPTNLEARVLPHPPGSAVETPKSQVLPAWQRYAVAFSDPGGRPRIVIVIDDLGMDRKRTARAMRLKGPLTLSFLAYAEDLTAQTAAARAGGHELLVHVGMEPVGDHVDPGPDVLLTGLGSDEIRRLLERNLGQFEGYVGINNHMGSKFTADASGMKAVMEVLKLRGLLFLDSLTSGRSVGVRLARETGVPVAERNIFLDNVNDSAAINERLRELEHLARRRGHAVAIGHPRDATLDALEGWLDRLDDRGLALVPLSAVVVANQDGRLQSAGHNGETRPTLERAAVKP